MNSDAGGLILVRGLKKIGCIRSCDRSKMNRLYTELNPQMLSSMEHMHWTLIETSQCQSPMVSPRSLIVFFFGIMFNCGLPNLRRGIRTRQDHTVRCVCELVSRRLKVEAVPFGFLPKQQRLNWNCAHSRSGLKCEIKITLKSSMKIMTYGPIANLDSYPKKSTRIYNESIIFPFRGSF